MSTPPNGQLLGRGERILIAVVIFFAVCAVAAMVVPVATFAAAAAIFDRSPRAIMVVSSIGMAIPLVLAWALLVTTAGHRMLRIAAGSVLGVGVFCDLMVSTGQLTQPLSSLTVQARESGEAAISAAMGVAAWCCMLALAMAVISALVSAIVVVHGQGIAGIRRRLPAPRRKGKAPAVPGPVQWFAGWRPDSAGVLPMTRRALGWSCLVWALALVLGAIVLVA